MINALFTVHNSNNNNHVYSIQYIVERNRANVRL